MTRLYNGDHQTGGLTAAAAIRSFVFWEGVFFFGRIREEFIGYCGVRDRGNGGWWACREGFLGSLGFLVAPLGGSDQPISGRQSP